MWYLIGSVILLVVLYLLAIMPRVKNRPDYTPLLGNYYAHRGLHDNEGEAPENSMAAFEKAVDAGYGMELDVQLTKDSVPVIFHDETLERICGVAGKVRDFTYQELQEFRLCKSEEKIPKLADFLTLVSGKVPLIIEIKSYESPARVCAVADELISRYQGAYCIESFHPMVVSWYRRHRPSVIRGQLSTNFKEKAKSFPDLAEDTRKIGKRMMVALWMVRHLLVNFIGRPDFIAYEYCHKYNLSRLLCQKLYGALSVAWTVRSLEEMKKSSDAFSLFIFEKFLP